jgi:hypothetical protein
MFPIVRLPGGTGLRYSLEVPRKMMLMAVWGHSRQTLGSRRYSKNRQYQNTTSSQAGSLTRAGAELGRYAVARCFPCDGSARVI